MYIEGGNNYSYLFQTTILISFKQLFLSLSNNTRNQYSPLLSIKSTQKLSTCATPSLVSVSLSRSLSRSQALSRSPARSHARNLSFSLALRLSLPLLMMPRTHKMPTHEMPTHKQPPTHAKAGTHTMPTHEMREVRESVANVLLMCC